MDLHVAIKPKVFSQAKSVKLYWTVAVSSLIMAVVVFSQPPPDETLGEAYRLNKLCKDKLNFNKISEFVEFVQDLKLIDRSNLIEFLINGDRQDAKALHHLTKCLTEKESIYALGDLIQEYDRVRACKMSQVDLLEAYAKKYLLNNTRSLTLRFYTLFGVNVGIKCRLNLLAHLKQADSEVEQLFFIYSIAAPTGWNALVNEHTKKSMKFGVSAYEGNQVIHRITKLVPGLSQIDHLDYLDFDHAMNYLESSENLLKNGVERGTLDFKNVKFKDRVISSLEIIIGSCKKLDKFYVNSLLAMAKLKELGLLVDFLNDLHARSALLHKWLVAASFCQLMARVRLLKDESGNSAHEGKLLFEIVHDESQLPDRLSLYTYVAPFDEIHEMASELVWRASVNEAAWRQRSEAMWLPGKSNDKSSVALKKFVQFVRGVEHDFQQEEEDET